MPTLTPEQLSTAAGYLHTNYADSDIVGYYTYLDSQGISYASLALGVVENDTLDGQVANAYAESVAASKNVDLSVGSDDWKDTIFNIATRDLAKRVDKIGVDLTWQDYDTIHTGAFGDVGLPAETWTSHTPLTHQYDISPSAADAEWNAVLANHGNIVTDLHNGLGIVMSGNALSPYLSFGDYIKAQGESALWDAHLAKALLKLDLEGLQTLIDPVLHPDFWTDFDSFKDFIDGRFGSDPAVPAGWPGSWPETTPTPFGYLSPAWIPGVSGPFGLGQVSSCPLVLDLGTGGISLTALSGSGSVYWNSNQTGFLNATGWVSGNTALLAIDSNHDGVINNNGELFGTQPSSGIANGFQALAIFDTNSDGHISSADTQFGDLIVWTDDDHDGYSQSGELHTLASLSITDIDLGYSSASTVINGNTLKQVSTFTMGGVSHAIADAWFDYDPINTRYADDYTLDIRSLFLPDQRGYGALPDLHIAISIDNSGTGNLLDLVEDFSAQNLSTIVTSGYDVQSKLEDILFRWAGVDGVSSTSRGSYFDAQKLEFLEKFVGQDYWWHGPGGASPTANPPSGAVPDLTTAWNNAFGTIAAKLLIQTTFADIYNHPVYDLVSDTLSSSDNTVVGFTGASAYTTDSSHNYILFANSANANVYGNAGNDVLIGSVASTAMDLYGAAGNDTYIYAAGFGTDKVHETTGHGTDTIQMSGYELADVNMYTDSSGYLHIVSVANSADNVVVDGGLTGSGSSENAVSNYVESIVFDDQTLDLTEGLHLVGTTSNESIYGSAHNDVIDGNGGGDNLYGNGGDDILIPRNSGSSYVDLYGGTGDDTYLFTAGFKTARVHESTGQGTDTIHMSGYDLADVNMSTDGSGYLYITSKADPTDNIRVDGGLTGSGSSENAVSNYVESIVFDDQTLDLTEGLHLVGTTSNESIYGSAHNDVIDGNGGGDNLYGNGGDDTLIPRNSGSSYVDLYGGTGDDTYLFTASFKTARVHESTGQGTDTIHMSGYDLADVNMYTDSSGYLYITSKADPTDNIRVDGGVTGSGSAENAVGNYLESIVFDDQTLDLTQGLLLVGTTSSESIYGSAYNDVIDGGGGGDNLYGNGGNDIMVAGTGTTSATYLYGGAGADTFEFHDGANNVSVRDFSTPQNDKLDISHLLESYNPVTDAITDFVQITDDGTNSFLSVDTDGLGGGYSFQQLATIAGVTGLTDEDALVTAGRLII